MCACARMHASIHAFTQARRACISLSLSIMHACTLSHICSCICIYIYVHIEMAFAMHARVPGRGYDMSGRARLTLRNARMRKTAFPACVHAYACDYIYLCIYLNLYVYAYNIRPRVRLHRSCMHK